MLEDHAVVILGAGVAGLAAASVLGDSAVTLEADERVGGLVKTENFNGYWFDHVLHLLHFSDPTIEQRIRGMFGEQLQRVPTEAWVEVSGGVARYPLQTHLGDLDQETALRCLVGLAKVCFADRPRPTSFEEMLRYSFGEPLCDLFFFPYNRKVWKRPLNELAPNGFQWNISTPDFEQVCRSVLTRRSELRPYNDNGWYPRPPRDSPQRGMELLSQQLARRAGDVRLAHRVVSIDLESRTIHAEHRQAHRSFRFQQACMCTLPLPQTIRLCRPAPSSLVRACEQLKQNRVVSVALSVQGPRPMNTGLWRYYSDESIVFTRLVFLHHFDPELAPPEGWGLLVEITEPSEHPVLQPHEYCQRVRQDVDRVGALPPGSVIIDEHVLVIDPAYVVFSLENQDVVKECRDFLAQHGVMPVGRYGRWEYSSMAQVMRDGFAWAEALNSPEGSPKLRSTFPQDARAPSTLRPT